MASPFRMFRKNQKVMMAVVTVLAMFAFVFLGTWTRMGGPSSEIQNPEVFTWKYGTVRKSDIQNQRFLRQWVRQFLLMARQTAGEDPRQTQLIISQSFPLTDEGIVESMILQKKADELGIVVSDKAINDFIRGWTDDRVRPQELAQIIANMSADRRSISQSNLFDALRFELAALRVQAMFHRMYDRREGMGLVFRGDTPADRWDYFCRLNRKVTAEMMPLPVEKFVSDVPNPTDAQLVAFYDQYKDSYPQPGSPTPGFKQPMEAQFQYFKADNDKLVAAELPKVTEQEIKEYYDRYKDVFFKKTQLPDEPGKTDEKSGETKSGGKSDAKSGGDKSDDSKKSGDSKKQSSVAPPAHSLNGELLALADGAEIEVAQAAKAGGEKSEAPKSDSTKGAEKPAADQPAGGKDSKAGDAAPPPQRPVEYEPLSKVSDKIRNSVAAQKVEHKVDDAFNALRLQMDQFGRAMDKYRRDQTRGDTNAKAPAPLDVAALAKQHGLEAKQTDLITYAQAAEDTDLGKSHQLVAGSYNITPFVQMAFQPNFPKFQAQETEDLEKNRYLWWKLADEPVRIPPLDSIKDKVVHAWKMIEARKLAQAKADDYATEARRLQKPLKEVFKDKGAEIFTAGPFSWMSRRTSDPNAFPVLTEVSGVKDAGNDFMKAVFALQPGQAGVAANQPLTMYYVVQIESEEPKQDKLREEFITSMETPAAASVYAMIGASENAGIRAAWLKELESALDFKLAPGQALTAGQEME